VQKLLERVASVCRVCGALHAHDQVLISIATEQDEQLLLDVGR
jgi:hypothetical protein